jgi:hypothetical protein
MLNIKTTVVTAFRTSTALATLINDRIFFHFPLDFNTLPSISYLEVANVADLYADNLEIASGITYQIDVWSKSSTTAIAVIVDDIMKGVNFYRINAFDLFEKDTNIYHKAMIFKIDLSDPTF